MSTKCDDSNSKLLQFDMRALKINQSVEIDTEDGYRYRISPTVYRISRGPWIHGIKAMKYRPAVDDWQILTVEPQHKWRAKRYISIGTKVTIECVPYPQQTYYTEVVENIKLC